MSAAPDRKDVSMPPKPEDLVRRGMIERLTKDEWEAVTACCSHVQSWPARTPISRKGEPLDRSLLVVEGLVARHVPGPHRDLREMVALEMRGDFVDLHSFPIGSLDHDVTAMTDVRLAVFPHAALRRLVTEQPSVGMALWKLTVLDGAIHRYWSFRIGALRASSRVANFICEMQTRFALAGMGDATEFRLPLTQTDLGEACGMSAVHVNRVVRELREAECCVIRDGRVKILDYEKLRRTGQYEPYFTRFDLPDAT